MVLKLLFYTKEKSSLVTFLFNAGRIGLRERNEEIECGKAG